MANQLTPPREPGRGLVVRSATPADVEPLAAFNVAIHGEESLGIWTRDVLSGRHPTVRPEHCVLVLDPAAGDRIVSTACLVPQTWRYRDIRLPIGQIELVGTDEAYRRQGLQHSVFDAIHALSGAAGHLMQAIVGAPWLYRRFGYEYALSFRGSRFLVAGNIPPLLEGQAEPFAVAPAAEEHIPAMLALYDQFCAGRLVTVARDAARFQYDLTGHSPGSDARVATSVVLDAEGQVVAYFRTFAFLWETVLAVIELVIDEAAPAHQVLPAIARALGQQGAAYAAEAEADFEGLIFDLGTQHPAYQLFDARLDPLVPPSAWYVRVPDLPALVRQIAPALERNLAASPMRGYSGPLDLTFYDAGLGLEFAQGRLVGVAGRDALAAEQTPAQAGFPPQTFLQLLFGYRSLADLRYAFPDCWADSSARLLLEGLFPPTPSWVLPLG